MFISKNSACAAVAIWIAAACTGCGDSSSSAGGSTATATPNNNTGITTEPGEGIWRGKIESGETGGSDDVFVLIDGWGFAEFITPDGQWRGVFSRDDISPTDFEITGDLDAYALPGRTWPHGEATATISVTGLMSHTSGFNARYEGGGDSGLIVMAYDQSSFRTLDVGRLDGTWVARNTVGNITATIDIRDSLIEGSDDDGCIYSGTAVGDKWTSVVLFQASIAVANCPLIGGIDINGDYEGPAGVTDIRAGAEEDDLLLIGLASDKQVVNLKLERL